MRYMLMMHAPRGTGEYQVNAWSPDDLKAHIGFMHDLNKELIESGELAGAEGLADPRLRTSVLQLRSGDLSRAGDALGDKRRGRARCAGQLAGVSASWPG